MKPLMIAAAAAAVALGASSAAQAQTACSLANITPTALACSGFYAGNLLSAQGVGAQQAGLAAIGFTWNGNFSSVTKINSLGGLTNVDFSTANQNPLSGRLYGISYVGLHFGNGAGLGGQVTGFFKFDAGSAGLQSFNLNILNGSSGAVLYATNVSPGGGGGGGGGGLGAVPEPASWAMLITGFGIVGIASRRRRALPSAVAA